MEFLSVAAIAEYPFVIAPFRYRPVINSTEHSSFE
jgi:hypothetical protein